MVTSYQQLLKRLLNVNIHGGIKLGLDNCLRLDAALNSPSQTFPSIHIAGTNGKGSVATKIATALQASGQRVGLYTSPHIACFRERIRINGEMIPEKEVQKHLKVLFDIVDRENIPATFFELTTLLAFAYFAEQQIDTAVIETGLGGRFDATNIVKTQLAVITSIGLDHTEILGNTIEKIAYEKAGIIKPGIPVVLGPRLPSAFIEKIAAKQNSPCIKTSGVFQDFDEENNAIAKTAMETLNLGKEAIENGLQAIPPCRLQLIMQPSALFPVILDVAHNPDGIAHLLASIRLKYPHAPLRFVLGLSKSKDIASCLKLLKNAATHFHLVEARNGRAAPSEVLQQQLLAIGIPQTKITCEKSVKEAIAHAIAGQELIVICGTFFIMADAREALGIDEPRDIQDLNERMKDGSRVIFKS